MIKKILYNGYHFRSQTEAKWAMLFDKLDIDYIYEPDCHSLYFKNKQINYLPDFYLPTLNRFIEVKNMGLTPPTIEECRKAILLAQQNTFGAPVTIVFGEIHANQNIKNGSGRTYTPNGNIICADVLTECPHCKKIDFCKNGNLRDMTCTCKQLYINESNFESQRIVSSLKNVRMHRFFK